MVTVACAAPSNSPDSTQSAPPPTTILDAGTGPTSITQTITTREVAGGFAEPTAMVNRPMRNQLWVAERAGKVRVVTIETNWDLETGQSVQSGKYTVEPNPVLDITSDVSTEGERGLLGIAFSTDARTLYLNYVNRKGEIVIAAWTVTDPIPPPPEPPAETTTTIAGQTTLTTLVPPTTTPPAPTTTVPPKLPEPVIDGRTRFNLMTIKPSEGTTANGGQLALGRDGYLYIGVGDAGKPSDAKANTQNPESLLGKILRIDPTVSGFGQSFGIPPTNPFATAGGAPPVWILGVRNPLRFSFDDANGDLWIGDPGENKFEEIDWLPASSGGGRGANLGWPWKEGTTAVSDKNIPNELVDPIFVYNKVGGATCSVVGGYVYRGSSMPKLQGTYIYGDHCNGLIRGLLQRKGKVLDDKAIGGQLPANQLVAFGQDDRGELYAVASSGSILKLVAA